MPKTIKVRTKIFAELEIEAETVEEAHRIVMEELTPIDIVSEGFADIDIMQDDAPSSLNINDIYVVSGRVHGDDDDSVYLVEATDPGQADDIFRNHLQSLAQASDEVDIYVNTTEPLSLALNERLIDSANSRPVTSNFGHTDLGHQNIIVKLDEPESEQMQNFQNATLHQAGEGIACSIAIQPKYPSGIMCQQAIADYLTQSLSNLSSLGWHFEIRIGLDCDQEDCEDES